MKSNAVIHLTITAQSGSLLEKMVRQFIDDREKNRKSIQEEYNKRVEKQIKKIGQSKL